MGCRQVVSDEASRRSTAGRQRSRSRQGLARSDAEPAAWTIEKLDTIPHKMGSPGIYGDGISEIYFDNVKVYKNQ